jgi:diguanylate cyclase (GGDEF)-like protein
MMKKHMAVWSKSWVIRFALTLLVGCLLLIPPVGGGRVEGMSPPLQLTAGQERYEVGPHLEILLDPDERWTIEAVSSPLFATAFSPVSSSTLNLGITKTTVWLRFALSGNPPGVSQVSPNVPWLLDIGWPFFSMVDAYLVRPFAAGAPQKIEKFPFGGSNHPFKAGIAEQTGILVRLPELSAPEQVIYLRLRADGVFFLHPVICTVKNYLETSTRRMLWFGLYFGILLALLLYNLFLYFCLRDRSYLWYVASIGAIGLYFLGTNRLTYEFLTDFPPVAALRLNLGFFSVSMVALLLFVRCFLQTHQRAPLLDRIIWGVILLQVAIMVPVLFASIAFLDQVYSLASCILPFVIIAAAVVCWRRGYRPARFLVISWVLYGFSGMVYILTFRGLLPFTGLTYHSFQIGSALEAILLSFALADRINLLRREREELSRSERRHRELAITDTLTGLYNLRYFRAQIDLEMELVDRLEQKLTLMMLDVDNFKLFNDRYGHPEGDNVLATLGRVMISCVRDKDVPCRYGGEEFAIILPGGQNSTAVEIYERINAELAKHRFGCGGEEAGRVTLSIGVAEHIPGERAETLLRRADQALYEAKARGRNQIIIASREPEAAFFACISEPESDGRLSLPPG